MSVIVKPLVTEKMTDIAEQRNQFGFVVDRKANKLQIRQAVEEMYSVVVTDVRTMNYMGKKSTRYTTKGLERGSKPSFKKAVVSLAEGDTIDFYAGI